MAESDWVGIAVERVVPLHGIVHVGDGAHDEAVEALPEFTLPSGHCSDVVLDGTVAFALRDLRVPAGTELRFSAGFRDRSAASGSATLSEERIVRYGWPGKFTDVYSPAHSDFRPSYCEEPELWFGFEIEFATSDSEACDRVVIGIRHWNDQVRWSFGVVHTVIGSERAESPINGRVSRLAV